MKLNVMQNSAGKIKSEEIVDRDTNNCLLAGAD